MRCKAIQMEHGPYITERIQKAVYIYCAMSMRDHHSHELRLDRDSISYPRWDGISQISEEKIHW
jgi:hypothetical protein